MIKYCVFILSHGRPDNVLTYKTLINHGYSGEIFIILDDEDKTIDKYKQIYKNKVIIFSKEEILKNIDICDNFKNKKATVYARNASFDIAKKLGYRYFIQLDDDYTSFEYKYYLDNYIGSKKIKNINKVFDLFFEYYISIPALSITFAQGGDFIGGDINGFAKSRTLSDINRKRKVMQSFFCDTERRFWFRGTMNDDVSTYTSLGSIGKLFLTIPVISLQQKPTQIIKGGMSDIYLKYGTYIKSFYSVMQQPSSIIVAPMGGATKQRLHHKIKWLSTVPMIINQNYKKEY